MIHPTNRLRRRNAGHGRVRRRRRGSWRKSASGQLLRQSGKARRWSRERAARMLGLTRARVDELFDGPLDAFTVEDLIGIGSAVDVTIHAGMVE